MEQCFSPGFFDCSDPQEEAADQPVESPLREQVEAEIAAMHASDDSGRCEYEIVRVSGGMLADEHVDHEREQDANRLSFVGKLFGEYYEELKDVGCDLGTGFQGDFQAELSGLPGKYAFKDSGGIWLALRVKAGGHLEQIRALEAEVTALEMSQLGSASASSHSRAALREKQRELEIWNADLVKTVPLVPVPGGSTAFVAKTVPLVPVPGGSTAFEAKTVPFLAVLRRWGWWRSGRSTGSQGSLTGRAPRSSACSSGRTTAAAGSPSS